MFVHVVSFMFDKRLHISELMKRYILVEDTMVWHKSALGKKVLLFNVPNLYVSHEDIRTL